MRHNRFFLYSMHPDSPENVTEVSNSTNNGETNEVKEERIPASIIPI